MHSESRSLPVEAGEPAPARASHPLSWVPSLYFAMGTPLHAVTVVSAVMYKNLGLTNAQIGLYTGSLYLPWVIKPLWAPLLELHRAKRTLVFAAELATAFTLGGVALALGLPHYLGATLALFWLTAFASATQDVAADGVYIAAMDAERQAQYAGVQGICWSASKVIAAGVLVELTQWLHAGMGASWPTTWAAVMGTLAALMAALALWHRRALPDVKDADIPARMRTAVVRATVAGAWRSFLRRPRIGRMLAVVFFYRFGEGFIEKAGPLLLMDARAVGGLGLDNAAVGRIQGTYATLGFLLGALGGGLFVARMTLRRSFWMLAIALNVPHLTYSYLSVAQPESLTVIAVVATIEKLGYGIGSVGHMLYMMQQLASGPYRTAHYAFATGVMGLSMMVAGMTSGWLQQWLGYQAFFAFVLAASVPSIALAWTAPFGRTCET